MALQKHTLYWVLQIIGWTTYAFLNVFFLLLSTDQLFVDQIATYFLSAGFYLFSTHMLRKLIISQGWLKAFLGKVIPYLLITFFVLSLLAFVFQVLVSAAFGIIDLERDLQFRNFFANVFSSLILFILWTLIYFIYHYFDNYNTSLKYEVAINEVKLKRLRSQLNPHFIFNALNSIRALVDEDPDKSQRAITQLSNILRNSLVMDDKKLIGFLDELATIKDYLALEGIRFEERLKVKLDIAEGSSYFDVPPLMLQTLVENGIKHGISNIVAGGLIEIRTEVGSDRLVIHIINSGQLDPNKPTESGYGIKNTKERLELLYGNEAKFSIANMDEKNVITTLEIPRKI
ncbi:MAG: histidine kinase [Cyclobacteriaceae bacterium]|nr:histidine kinase [Cyclobacteriaceae bacterium]MCH8515864.1 histidine kinase [Cyclobacteriaceae bacterium]